MISLRRDGIHWVLLYPSLSTKGTPSSLFCASQDVQTQVSALHLSTSMQSKSSLAPLLPPRFQHFAPELALKLHTATCGDGLSQYVLQNEMEICSPTAPRTVMLTKGLTDVFTSPNLLLLAEAHFPTSPRIDMPFGSTGANENWTSPRPSSEGGDAGSLKSSVGPSSVTLLAVSDPRMTCQTAAGGAGAAGLLIDDDADEDCGGHPRSDVLMVASDVFKLTATKYDHRQGPNVSCAAHTLAPDNGSDGAAVNVASIDESGQPGFSSTPSVLQLCMTTSLSENPYPSEISVRPRRKDGHCIISMPVAFEARDVRGVVRAVWLNNLRRRRPHIVAGC